MPSNGVRFWADLMHCIITLRLSAPDSANNLNGHGPSSKSQGDPLADVPHPGPTHGFVLWSKDPLGWTRDVDLTPYPKSRATWPSIWTAISTPGGHIIRTLAPFLSLSELERQRGWGGGVIHCFGVRFDPARVAYYSNPGPL